MNVIEELRKNQNAFKRECDAAEDRSFEFAIGAAWGMYHAIDNLIDTLAEQTEEQDAKHNGGCCEQDEAVMIAEEGDE